MLSQKHFKSKISDHIHLNSNSLRSIPGLLPRDIQCHPWRQRHRPPTVLAHGVEAAVDELRRRDVPRQDPLQLLQGVVRQLHLHSWGGGVVDGLHGDLFRGGGGHGGGRRGCGGFEALVVGGVVGEVVLADRFESAQGAGVEALHAGVLVAEVGFVGDGLGLKR